MGTLKDQVGPASIGRLADALSSADPSFRRREFERAAVRRIGALELKARIDQVAAALATCLPPDFAAASAIVEAGLSDDGLGVWELWPVTVWVGAAGTGRIDRAAQLLALLTGRCSGEFGVRPLIEADPERMRAILLDWGGAQDEHVRRLASEGPRPLLPWALRLTLTAADPTWGVPILDLLIDDPTVYVRRSVANHLNDIAKLDRAVALSVAQRWKERGGEHVHSILVHGLRTLTRQGDRVALSLVDLDLDAAIEVERLIVLPQAVRVGEQVTIDLALRSDERQPVAAACGYVLEFARASGRPARKLFTLGTLSLAPSEVLEFRRSYTFRPLSTRTYHPGPHAVEIVVNGQSRARVEFTLQP